MSAEFRICLIEDDEIMGESISMRLELEGYAYNWHRDGASAQRALLQRKYGAVVSDIRLPDMTGETLFSDLFETGANLPPFIFITGHGTIDQAVRLLKLGALDYIIKPFEMSILLEKLAQLRASAEGTPGKDDVLGISPAMRAIEGLLLKLATSSASVLITGESGVGKECVALKLHQLSEGAVQRPFIAVNCGALTETLLEAELFGYEKGAFTGAVRTKKGVFEQADCGTLFLDEIGDMSAIMQVKVLRAIQEKKIVHVGGETPILVNIRLICATHRDLLSMVEQGEFREDLYYRINVIQIKIPPLRERQEDILWLARKFLDEYAIANPGQKKVLPPPSQQALIAYPWPGNVRELKHCLERACILHNNPILAPGMLFDKPQAPDEVDSMSEQQLSGYLAECERKYILRSLQSQNWSIQETANQIGISRKNLWEKMRKLDITRGQIGKEQ